MKPLAPPILPQDAAISNNGERVSPLHPDFIYYAHLSLYHCALPYAQGGDVLDAGCGTGYGSAYLLENGARSVLGVDVSPEAIAFCQRHFQRPGLTYGCQSLERLDLPPASFDLIYSSNVLEHVPDVWAFLRAAHAALRPEGRLFIAVPPIVNESLEYQNLINPYHVNVWSPRQWQAVIGQFFEQVQPYRHADRLSDAERAAAIAGQHNDLAQFDLLPAAPDDLYTLPSITAVFTAQAPRASQQLPAPGLRVYLPGSYTRPEGRIPPEARRRLQPYFEAQRAARPGPLAKAGQIVRREGLAALARRTTAWLQRKFSA